MARKIIFFLCIGIGLFCLTTAHADEPDENDLKLESGVFYTIQKGDTLWDISELFFDSAWIWPDLWEKNKDIANPHWIYPNNRIRIYGREGQMEPPKPGPKIKAPVGAALVGAAASVAPPPPLSPGGASYDYFGVNMVGFIRKKPVIPSATVFKVKDGWVMASDRDLVYVRPERGGQGELEKGKRYTVYRNLGRVKDPETKKIIGIQHYIVGVVEIIRTEPKYSIGKIVKSFRHIEVDDLLMPYDERSPKITLTEGIPGFRGKIIGTEEHLELFAHRDVVFVDKGRNDGVEIGQQYSAYYQDEEFVDAEREQAVLLAPVNFGKILIVRTEETTSTAVVTKTHKAIEPGDKVHTPLR